MVADTILRCCCDAKGVRGRQCKGILVEGRSDRLDTRVLEELGGVGEGYGCRARLGLEKLLDDKGDTVGGEVVWYRDQEVETQRVIVSLRLVRKYTCGG